MQTKLLILSLISTFTLAAIKPPATSKGARVAANEVIIKFADALPPAAIARITELTNADSFRPIGDGTLYRLHSRSSDVPALLKLLQDLPDVIRVEANALSLFQKPTAPEPTPEVASTRDEQTRMFSSVSISDPFRLAVTVAPLTSNDPYLGQQWSLSNTGQFIWSMAAPWLPSAMPPISATFPSKSGSDIKARQAWAVTTGSQNVVVALVDSGIIYTHPDLAPNVWSNPGGLGGCPKGTHGFVTIPGTTTPCDPVDHLGHGVYMAGIIGAAGNNGIGIAGINWAVTLMEIKVGETEESVAAVISGIQLAIQAKQAGVNVRVISAPLEFATPSESLRQQMILAGQNNILIVAGAGNEGNDITISGSTPIFPASWDLPNLISVAATDNQDKLWQYSNYGRETVHLGAPGDRVLSTGLNNEYGYFCCTSGATATVAGAAALILSAPGQGSLSAADLKNRILATVDPLPSLANVTQTGGRLNLCAAMPGCGSALVVTAAPNQITFAQTGGTSTIKLSAGGLFRARTDHPLWVTVSFQSSGVLTVSVARNQTGASRTASIWIAGLTVPVTQN